MTPQDFSVRISKCNTHKIRYIRSRSLWTFVFRTFSSYSFVIEKVFCYDIWDTQKSNAVTTISVLPWLQKLQYYNIARNFSGVNSICNGIINEYFLLNNNLLFGEFFGSQQLREFKNRSSWVRNRKYFNVVNTCHSHIQTNHDVNFELSRIICKWKCGLVTVFK